MQINKYLKHICFLFILISLFILLPFTCYASGEFSNNAAGNSSSSASGSGLGNDTKTLYSDTSGYRITLIDPNTGEVKSKSIDILFSTPPTSNIQPYNTSRVEATGIKNDYDYYLNTKIQDMLIDAGYTNISNDPIPTWFTRNGKEFSGESNTFRDWFCPESAIDALSGFKTVAAQYEEEMKQLDILATNHSISYTTARMASKNRTSVLYDKASSIIYDKANIYTQAQAREAFDIYVSTVSNEEAWNLNNSGPGSHQILLESLWKSLIEKYPDEVNTPLSVRGYDFPKSSTVASNIFSNEKYNLFDFLTLTSYATDGISLNNLLGSEDINSISDLYVDDTHYNVDKYGWALAILSLENNGISIFAKNGESGKEIANIFRYGEAYICVEPVLFFKPQTSKNYPYTFWGTPKNYADFSMGVLASWDPVALSGGNIFRGTNIVFFRSFILAQNEGPVLVNGVETPGLASEKGRTAFLKDEPYRGGNEPETAMSTYGKYTEARYRAETAQDLIKRNFGIGMHLYCIGSSGSSINTYDVVNNPSHDYTTESPVGKSSEGNDYRVVDKDRKFQIAKFYRVKMGNEYIEWSHYATTNTPHTVDITDESNIGWKLTDWFTSTSTWLPDADEDPEKYPWESYVKGNNPLGTYSGTQPGRIIVQPTDPDNTLYLLYEATVPGENDNSPDKIHTYNITTNPTDDDPSEPSTGKKDPDTYGSKALTFKIDKHYRYKDSATGAVTEVSYYTTVNAPHTVVIQDELQQTGYKLMDWFTSTDDWLPTTGQAPSNYNWESVVKGQHKNGQYAGTGETTLVVKPTDPDNVLHLLYEYQGTAKLNVVKIFKNDDDSINHTEGPEVINNTPVYPVESEPGYDYIETLISTKDPTPNNPNGNSTTEKSVPVPDGTKTLYIIYKSPGQQIKLYSNELSYTYTLKDLVSTRILFSIYDTVPASPGYSPSCTIHWRSCSNPDHDGHSYTCGLSYHRLSDGQWTVKVANNYNYDSKTTFIRDYKNTGNLGSTWSTSISGTSVNASSGQVAKPNGSYLLYRQKDKDLVTLYPEKNNNSLLSKLKDLGITKSAYKPNGTRLATEMTKDDYFTNHFQTYLQYTSHDQTLYWKWPRLKCNTGHGGSYTTNVVTTPEDANDYYSGASGNSQNVKEYYFVGESNEGLSDAVDSRETTFNKTYSYNKGYASTSSLLKFYPYAKMFYRDKDDNNNLQPVYVTSENLSTMKVFNAIQAGVYKKNEINVNLDSTQWSTHARSLSFLKDISVDDKKSVLPGGAIQDLDMGNQGDTKLAVRVWQSCLPDEQVKKVQDGFKVSVTEAKKQATTLQSEIESVLKGYGLVQFGISGVKTTVDDVRTNGEELHESTNIDFVYANGGKTSSDSKYYLRHDATGSSRANFDVLGTKVDSQILYTIKSDTDGNVILYKNGSEMKRITMTQTAKDMIGSNVELATLDDCTKLITNYIDAIDRGKGEKNMYDRKNANKYNEAFDGVSVLVTVFTYDIGFSANSGHRTNVLDPALVGQADSKSDLYNFDDESKIRSSVYATNLVSTTSTVKEEGYLGTLKGINGIGDLKITLGDIYKLAYTKNFYIPNATVSDLN